MPQSVRRWGRLERWVLFALLAASLASAIEPFLPRLRELRLHWGHLDMSVHRHPDTQRANAPPPPPTYRVGVKLPGEVHVEVATDDDPESDSM
jgi:hypothetical protein